MPACPNRPAHSLAVARRSPRRGAANCSPSPLPRPTTFRARSRGTSCGCSATCSTSSSTRNLLPSTRHLPRGPGTPPDHGSGAALPTGEIAMSREAKRVPLSFDWPLQQVWRGYVNPHAEKAVRCEACAGTGYSQAAKRIADEWYGYAPFDPAGTGSRPFGPDHPKVRALAERNVDAEHHGGSMSREYLVRREAERLAGMWDGQWCHHLAQADVDALAAADRLWDFTRRPRTEEQRQALGDGYWMSEPNGYRPTAAEI